MQVSVGSGTYVVAVSGGMDSMVLLDLLAKRVMSIESRVMSQGPKTQNSQLRTHNLMNRYRFIVAHFDHGIRAESVEDRKLVQDAAKNHQLPFVFKNGNLGPGTSEAAARKARYQFLYEVQNASKAKAIITAHHQDDVLETAILNLLRGTGRRGLTSLKSTDTVLRPLLGYSKEHLREYALNHSIKWHEDASNADTRYKRNHIRHNILPRFSAGQRAQLVILLEDLKAINHETDQHIVNLLHSQPALDVLERRWFILLSHDIAKEVVHAWLRRYKIRNLTKRTVERLIVAMKTGRPGQQTDVDKQWALTINKDSLILTLR